MNVKSLSPQIFSLLIYGFTGETKKPWRRTYFILYSTFSSVHCRAFHVDAQKARPPKLPLDVNIWWENNKRTPITHASTWLKHYQSRCSRELQIELQQSLTSLRSVSLSAVIFFKETWRDDWPISSLMNFSCDVTNGRLGREVCDRGLIDWIFGQFHCVSRHWKEIDLNSRSGDVKIKSLTSD